MYLKAGFRWCYGCKKAIPLNNFTRKMKNDLVQSRCNKCMAVQEYNEGENSE